MLFRKLVPLIALVLLALAGPASSQFALFQVGSNAVNPAVTCNLVTGVVTGNGTGPCTAGTSCNGTDDSTAVLAFNAWGQTWEGSHTGQIELYIPSGSNCVVSGGWQGSGQPLVGLHNVIVMGYGATITASCCMWAGSDTGIVSGDGHYGNSDIWTARLTSNVSAGATSVFIDPSRTSIFSVNTWALISGYDIQGSDSTPPSWHFFQYVYITAINAGTGQVTFSEALNNAYRTDWPQYGTGSPGAGHDYGGPGTLYKLTPNWDAVFEWRGITFDIPIVQTDARDITFRDVTWLTPGVERCMTPSQSLTIRTINNDFTGCFIEADKEVTAWIDTGSTHGNIQFQSSSFGLFQASNGYINSMQSTPRVGLFTDMEIHNLRVGVSAFGRSDEFTCIRCNLPDGVGENSLVQDATNGINNKYSISGGTITTVAPDSDDPYPMRWSVPGTNLCWGGQYACQLQMFQVTGVTQTGGVGGPTVVTTSLGAGVNAWPNVIQQFGTNIYLKLHPSPKFTCTGCYGSIGALSLNNATPGAPLFSYTTFEITDWTWASSGFSYGSANTMWGKVTSLVYNIATQYTGSQNPFQLYCATSALQISAPSGSSTNYLPQVDMRTGPRTVTVNNSGVTGNVGTDANLALPWANDTWINGECNVAVQQHIGTIGSPPADITLTIQTDQGVVIP